VTSVLAREGRGGGRRAKGARGGVSFEVEATPCRRGDAAERHPFSHSSCESRTRTTSARGEG